MDDIINEDRPEEGAEEQIPTEGEDAAEESTEAEAGTDADSPAADGTEAGTEPDVEVYRSRRGRDVHLITYDFRRPIQLSKGFVRSLSMVGETYSKLLTLSLSNFLRIPVVVRATGVRQVLFEEYTQKIPNPSCINILDLKPIKIPGILELDLSIFYTMIEKLLGSHLLTNDVRREFSTIEMRIARKIVTRMLADLQAAMLRIIEVQVDLRGIEHNPDFTYIMNANDPCILMDFDVDLAEFKGPMTVCVSLGGLDAELGIEGAAPYRDVRSEAERRSDQQRLSSILGGTHTEVVVEVGKMSMPLAAFERLREGSVINLRKQIQESLLIKVGGSPVFRGKMGRFNKKAAARVTEVLWSETLAAGKSKALPQKEPV